GQRQAEVLESARGSRSGTASASGVVERRRAAGALLRTTPRQSLPPAGRVIARINHKPVHDLRDRRYEIDHLMPPMTISTFGAGCRLSIPGRLRRKANRPANRIAGALLPRCCPEEELMSLKNRQVLLASRPKGEPTPENFRLVEA